MGDDDLERPPSRPTGPESTMTPIPAKAHGKLYALAVAIEAVAARDPYPRLARVMQHLASQPSGSGATWRALSRR
jgi:hypothetical protein